MKRWKIQPAWRSKVNKRGKLKTENMHRIYEQKKMHYKDDKARHGISILLRRKLNKNSIRLMIDDSRT